MSNPFKAIGKVFKAVVKVAKKVAIPALMIGAVVLTGGAALGALPAIGSVLGSIGISGTLASVLGGAISMGAVGAVTGGITGALTGKGFLKGATGGFLMGAATGGLLGGVGVLGPNGLFGTLGQGAAATATAAPTAGITVTPGAGLVPPAANPLSLVPGAPLVGQTATTAATTIGQAATAAGATQAAGGGIGGLLGSGGIGPLIQGAGQIISGFASGKAAEAELEARQELEKDEYDRIAFNYGYRNIYDGKSRVPSSVERWFEPTPVAFEEPSFMSQGLLRTAPSQFIQPTQYKIVNNQVVPVAA